MTEDERREWMQAVAEIVDNFLDDDLSFVLISFPEKPPADQEPTRFDIISNNSDRQYVATVLQHVVDGIDEDLDQPGLDLRPN